MRDDVPSTPRDDQLVVHGYTHTQEQLAALRPLRLGGLRVLVALVVSGLFGILAHYEVLRRQEGDAIGAGMIGVVISAFMLMFLALALTGGRNPVDWLRQYWRRNVRGYAVAYWLDDRGQLVGSAGHRLRPGLLPMSEHSPTIYLPLGGWLHQPRIADYRNYLHEHGVRVRWPWFERAPDRVWVADGNGAHIKLWVRDALVLLCSKRGYLPNYDWLEIASRNLRDLERLEQQHGAALDLLLEVYDRIVATKRFIKSTQAQAIADDLRRRLDDLLPHDHPRRHEFARRPMTKTAPSAAKT